jgi:hypothetical protein
MLAMQSCTKKLYVVPIFLLVLFLYQAAAQNQDAVQSVVIHSGWGGLGTPQGSEIKIELKQGGYKRAGKPVDPVLIDALVKALQAADVPRPEMEDLGVTKGWLEAQASSPEMKKDPEIANGTAEQKALFTAKFTDPAYIGSVFPDLFRFSRSDDYPGASVEVVFNNGSKLSARSHSYYLYMIPWRVDGRGSDTFNAAISRAVSALLPKGVVNRERLAGEGMRRDLAEAVMRSIKPKWDMLNAEARVGGSLEELRKQYEIVSTEINPWHHPEYGTATYKGEPEEINLHASLRGATFVPNVSVALVLRVKDQKADGVEQFLTKIGSYEDLTLSIPWLKEYIRAHPKVPVRISYVHDASFGDKAMRTFTADMKARGREDLIEQARAVQSQLVLLIVGMEYSESYWLVFPDRHLLLWRYGGASGLLNWTPADFPPGQCSEYQGNFGGCSGREVTVDGTLSVAQAPRDRECVARESKGQAGTVTAGDNLFPVMDRGRGGFIDLEGKIVIPLCFDKVGAFSEGLARFERDGSWGYIDTAGHVVIEPTFPWAEEFHEGFAHVQVTGLQLGINGRWGFIDRSGTVVGSPEYAETFGEKSNIGVGGDESAFHEGLAMVFSNYKYGFIDATGKVIIPVEFDYAGPFSEGLAPVGVRTGNDTRWGYVSRDGKWAIPLEFESADLFSNHLAGAKRGDECGYIDSSGVFRVHLPQRTSAADCSAAPSSFSEGLAVWRKDKLSGYIDASGKVAIAARFDSAMPFSEGLAAVRVHGKWGFIDKSGRMAIPPMALASVESFHHGLAFVRTEDSRYGYINRTGQFVWKPTFLYLN